MSNALTSNAWHLDTASATPVALTPGVIQSIYWDNGTSGAADDHCVITDADGNVIFHAHAAAKDYATTVTFPLGLVVNGLVMLTLTHGEVCIYWQHGNVPRR